MLRIGNLFETRRRRPARQREVNPLPGTAADPISLDAGGNHGQLPEQLSHPVHRRQDEPGRPAHHGGRPGSKPIPASLAAHRRNSARSGVAQLEAGRRPWPAPFKQGAPVVSQHAGRRRHVLLGARPAADAQERRPVVVGQGHHRRRHRSAATSTGPRTSRAGSTSISTPFRSVPKACSTPSNQPAHDRRHQSPARQTWPNLTQPNNPLYPQGACRRRGRGGRPVACHA